MEEIKGVARAVIRPGKLAEYKALCEQAMEIVRTQDTGTLQYEIFFNDDESEAIVYERYRDIDAALEHFAHIGHLMQPLMRRRTSAASCWANGARKCSWVAAAHSSISHGGCSRTSSRAPRPQPCSFSRRLARTAIDAATRCAVEKNSRWTMNATVTRVATTASHSLANQATIGTAK